VRQARSYRGFTLIEVLVALFVLSIGLVGAAAMQMKAGAARHQSALMSDAVQLAHSLAERMRANPVAMAAADAANPYLQLNYDSSTGAPVPPGLACLGDASCSPAAMAAFDLYETSRALYDGFPGARLLVCRDAAPWDAGADRLSWDCVAGTGAPIVIKLGWRDKARAAGDATFAPSIVLVAGAIKQ
jgi:type IV pilus assembly protein PilV